MPWDATRGRHSPLLRTPQPRSDNRPDLFQGLSGTPILSDPTARRGIPSGDSQPEELFEEAGESLERGDSVRRKLARTINGTLPGSAQVPVDEALRVAENGGALGGCDLSLAEGITKLVEVQDVVAISTGRYEEVSVEVMDDKSRLGEFDLDQVDIPPTFYWALERNGPGQLDSLIKQQVAAIDGRPSKHLILGEDPHVVGDNRTDPSAGTPLASAVEDPDVLDGGALWSFRDSPMTHDRREGAPHLAALSKRGTAWWRRRTTR